MKISSVGPNEIPPRRAGEGAGTPVVRGNEISSQQSSSAASQTSTRSFTEALVIAHTARNIVNRAMEIAFQLQGLATRTLASGSADQSEIARMVSAANALMSASERGPASAVVIPQINGVSRENRIIDYTPVRESLSSIKTQALHIQEGGMPDLEKINDAVELLGTAQESIESIHREFQSASPAHSLVNIEESGSARTAIARATLAMSSEQNVALTVQGNIRHERARELLG